MATYYKEVQVLSHEEYKQLTSPDVTYTLMTRTAANKGVESLLKKTESKCWKDSDDDFDPYYCNTCPVMEYLGTDAGGRLCQRQKSWDNLG